MIHIVVLHPAALFGRDTREHMPYQNPIQAEEETEIWGIFSQLDAALLDTD